MSKFSFNNLPVIRHSRSRFDLSHSVKTSANVGQLVPFEIQEVYAGDTFKIKTNVVSRLSSQFIRPVMDNLFLDVYYFFVPSRILYDKFVNIFGENTESAWANTVEYEVPTVPCNVAEHTVGDYLGLPIGDNSKHEISILPFRAFAKIYDDWFRDQNNVSPMHIQTGDVSSSEILNNNDWSPSNYTGRLPKVAKLHDYFTSSLPAPQKGEAPELGLSNYNDVPVYAGVTTPYSSDLGGSAQGVKWRQATKQDLPTAPDYYVLAGDNSLHFNDLGMNTVGIPNANPASKTNFLEPANLWSKTSELVGNSISVNDLRFAFQYQKMLERDARSGSRFVEFLASHFSVQAGDYRLQRSEYLGGRRSPISIHQVTQTTGANSESSPLAEVGAFSLSGAKSKVTKGFVENGYVIGVFCIRQFHSYQQGIERFWSRKKRTDFYDPVFSHIGEQPIYKKELYAGADVDEVFGYNEAWADLRYRPNRISAQMRTGAVDSLDVWHFGDYYSNAPTLNEQFINEVPDYVNRAITVESSAMDQFILDFYIQNEAYRVMPTYSVPSLIDHD